MNVIRQPRLSRKIRQYALLGVLTCISFVRLNLWIAPSPMMTDIMKELPITYAQGGMLLTTVTVCTGICMFVGSVLIDKLGNTKVMIIALSCVCLDGFIVYFTHSYYFMLLGRIITGIGHGLSSGATPSIILERFDPGQHAVVNSFNVVINGICTVAVYSITVPLMDLLGGWRKVLLLWSVSGILVLLLFILYVKKIAPGLAASTALPPEPATGAAKKGRASSLIDASRIKEVWYYTVAMIGAYFIYNALVAYLPSYLTKLRGFTAETAGVATGLMSWGGMAAGLVCGLIATKVRRKNLMIFWIFLFTTLSHIGISLATNRAILFACIIISGIGYSGWLPVSLTAIMQLRGMTPQLMGGANAIYLSFASLATFLVPITFQSLQDIWGMQMAMLLFGLVMIPSMASMLLFPKDSQEPAAYL